MSAPHTFLDCFDFGANKALSKSKIGTLSGGINRMKFLLYLVALLADVALFAYVLMSGGSPPSTGTLIAFAVTGILGLILLRQMKLAARDLGKKAVSSAIESHRARKDREGNLSEKEYARRLKDAEFSKEEAREMLSQKPKGFDQLMSQLEDDSHS